MKTILKCIVTPHNDGKAFESKLKLGEARLIADMARSHKAVTVTTEEIDEDQYALLFDSPKTFPGSGAGIRKD